MFRLAVAFVGSGTPCVLCLSQQWRENINYHFVIVNTVRNNTQGGWRGGKTVMPVAV